MGFGLSTSGEGDLTKSSAASAAEITDETGTGLVVFNNGPTLIAPALGTPASGVLTNCTGLPGTGLSIASQAEGDLLYFNGTNWVRMPSASLTLLTVRTASPLTVLTAGSPADLGTITVPAHITRYRLTATTGASAFNGAVAETAAGTLNAAVVQVWTEAGGTGTQVMSNLNLPTATGTFNAAGSPGGVIITTNTLHVRQTVDSANAGTINLYLTLHPIPA